MYIKNIYKNKMTRILKKSKDILESRFPSGELGFKSLPRRFCYFYAIKSPIQLLNK